MKKTMPFVQFVKARMDELGIAALDLKTDFDEAKVLSDNIDYIVNTLGLEDVEIKFSDEATEKIQEDCRPGKKLSKNEILRLAIKYIKLLSNVLDWQKQQENAPIRESAFTIRRPSFANHVQDTQHNQSNYVDNCGSAHFVERHNPSQIM